MIIVFVGILGLAFLALVVITALQKADTSGCLTQVTTCAYDKLIKGNGVTGDDLGAVCFAILIGLVMWYGYRQWRKSTDQVYLVEQYQEGIARLIDQGWLK